MGCPVPVNCRHCNEPLDVYEPHDRRFCSEDCYDIYHALKAVDEPSVPWDELKKQLGLSK